MTYQRGEIYPLDRTRPILGQWTEPTWYLITTPPQREGGATAWLHRIGATDVWYPTETCWRPSPRGPKAKVSYERCIAPGYLFTLFEQQPTWDVFFAVGKGRVSGVVSRGEVPYAIPEAALAQMQQVPQRIEKARKAAEAAERALRLANAPTVGGKAKLLEGPLAGYTVDVEAIHKGIAHFILGGVKGTAAVEAMKKAD